MTGLDWWIYKKVKPTLLAVMNFLIDILGFQSRFPKGGIVARKKLKSVESINVLIGGQHVATITSYDVSIPDWADMDYNEYQEIIGYCQKFKS